MKVFSEISCILLAIMLSMPFFTGCANRAEEDRLSEEQIAELREQYPIYRENPPLIEVMEVPFKEMKKLTETFVYGEITGDFSTYSKGTFGHYEYPVSVISDTEGKYEENESITISASKAFFEYQPQFSKGERIVVGIGADDKVDGRTHYARDCTFYVTEDGYVLTVYDESDEKEKYQFSGLKVETLMKKLKK